MWEECTTHVGCGACVVHPSARCAVQVGRAVRLLGSRCGLYRLMGHAGRMAEAGAHLVGVGRRQLLRSAKTMAD